MSNIPEYGKRRGDFGLPLPADTQRSNDSFLYNAIALGLTFLAGVAVGANLDFFNQFRIVEAPPEIAVKPPVASPDAALIAEGEELARFALKDPSSALFRGVKILGARKNVIGYVQRSRPYGGLRRVQPVHRVGG
jgi:hypothetical protein